MKPSLVVWRTGAPTPSDELVQSAVFLSSRPPSSASVRPTQHRDLTHFLPPVKISGASFLNFVLDPSSGLRRSYDWPLLLSVSVHSP